MLLTAITTWLLLSHGNCLYETSRNTSPVIKFIDEQQGRDQAVIPAVLNDVAENRFQAKGAQFNQLDGKL